MSQLVVPIQVSAYCIGDGDIPAVQRFAGATTDYTNQSSADRPCYAGANVERPLSWPPLWSLERGVHLHWMMPDALTRGVEIGKRMSFPALPNRWLVTRIVDDAVSTRSWLIESDHIATTPDGDWVGPTVTVEEAGQVNGSHERSFRYMGRTQAFPGSDRGPAPAGESLRDLTGFELNAVSVGDIAFTTFYPNARGIFGLHDDLTDVTTSSAVLLYVVCGWYDRAQNDPLTDGLSVAQIGTLGWTVDGAPADTVFNTTMCSGLVQGIQWDPSTIYVPIDSSAGAADGAVSGELAIGNSASQTLAAYFARKTQQPDFQQDLLALFSMGLLADVMQPAPDLFAKFEEALHAAEFSYFDGGTAYAIVPAGQAASVLPGPVVDALDTLNNSQQTVDNLKAELRDARWALFAAWYRIFEIPGTAANQQTAAQMAVAARHHEYSIINGTLGTAIEALAAARGTIDGLLTDGMTLKSLPAKRFARPGEPVILIAGPAAASPSRLQGDGRFRADGLLLCRAGGDTLGALSIAAASKSGPTDVTLTASEFTAMIPAGIDALPAGIAALVAEACLLDTAVGAGRTGQTTQSLFQGLSEWLEGVKQPLFTAQTGAPPSPVAVSIWQGANDNASLFMVWKAEFHPLLQTITPTDYDPDFFTANYTLDPKAPRRIGYRSDARIDTPPAGIDFTPGAAGIATYGGTAVLSTQAAHNLRLRIDDYLADTTSPEPVLTEIRDGLRGTPIALQSMGGFDDALITQSRSLQLKIGVPASSTFVDMTTYVAGIIGSGSEMPNLSPLYNGSYSAIRAGWMKVSASVVDCFGWRRRVSGDMYIASDMRTDGPSGPLPGIVYLPPRITEPARLLFRWLAADASRAQPAFEHAASNPICGWLLPSFLQIGFFFYTNAGKPLGSLMLVGDDVIAWQATPGDPATIDQTLATVMSTQNVHLRKIAVALADASPAAFLAMWKSIDAASEQVSADIPATRVELAFLVGHPLAIVQSSLVLERRGLAAFDQTFATYDEEDTKYIETDHALAAVQFPAVVGDISRLNDGLIGYYKQTVDGSYDLKTFYTDAAVLSDPAAVTKPTPTNILLTPHTHAASDPAAALPELKLLMIVDPRTAIHVATGILPTQTLVVPPVFYDRILGTFELTYCVAPLLRPHGGLAFPLPSIAGYDWSWITEVKVGTGRRWQTEYRIAAPTNNAMWPYAPQSITEGWLRLRPQVLSFEMTDQSGEATVLAGATMTLSLAIRNRRLSPIAFASATSRDAGAEIVIDLSEIVTKTAMGAIACTAPDWTFSLTEDAAGAPCWVARPSQTVCLAPGATLVFQLAGVAIAPLPPGPRTVSFSYDSIAGDVGGTDVAIVQVTG